MTSRSSYALKEPVRASICASLAPMRSATTRLVEAYLAFTSVSACRMFSCARRFCSMTLILGSYFLSSASKTLLSASSSWPPSALVCCCAINLAVMSSQCVSALSSSASLALCARISSTLARIRRTSATFVSDSSSKSAMEGISLCNSSRGFLSRPRLSMCTLMALCSVRFDSEAILWASSYFFSSSSSSELSGEGRLPMMAWYCLSSSSSFLKSSLISLMDVSTSALMLAMRAIASFNSLVTSPLSSPLTLTAAAHSISSCGRDYILTEKSPTAVNG